MADLPLPSSTGVYRSITGTDPAANTECSDTVPTGANEVQTITGTASGTFGLQIGGESGPTTLTTTATAADVQTYLRAFNSLGADGVTCGGGPLATTVTVTFDGVNTKLRNMPALAVTGSTTGLTFATTTAGTGPKSWVVQSYSVQLVQGATETPRPILVFDDGTNILMESYGASSAQSAAVTAQYTWAPGLTITAAGAAVVITSSIPDGMVLQPGYRVRTITNGKGANTNYGAPQLYVCELG